MKHLLETKRKVMRMRKKKSSVNKGEKSLIKSVVVLYVRVLLAALDGPPLRRVEGPGLWRRKGISYYARHCTATWCLAYVVSTLCTTEGVGAAWFDSRTAVGRAEKKIKNSRWPGQVLVLPGIVDAIYGHRMGPLNNGPRESERGCICLKDHKK